MAARVPSGQRSAALTGRPWQGHVVDWKHHSYKWEALVVYRDETLDGAPLVWKWFPVEQLRPLSPDPNPRTELNS